MRFLKTILTILAADILSLFIGMTLAFSGSIILRIISAVCTSGVMVCVVGSFAAKQACADSKAKIPVKPVIPAVMGLTASLPGLISWLVLRFSGVDFYRWHKLINGWFLQVYNFIEPDASSAALDSGEIMLMLPLCFAPMIVFIIGYFRQLSAEKNS